MLVIMCILPVKCMYADIFPKYCFGLAVYVRFYWHVQTSTFVLLRRATCTGTVVGLKCVGKNYMSGYLYSSRSNLVYM